VTGGNTSSHTYEIHVEGELSEVFRAAFPEMRSTELDPCVVLVVQTDDHTDAADLALRIRQLGHSVLSVRRRFGGRDRSG
jgi:hypothetical protein